ncbi:TetR/AcrR family transcriptional regulator [Thermocrispum municipale]|uniref:TetR/AcrR family transcriptional regulator n=1 Tax=Thermocrispum municipale TaxID=37926 RepID=UPI000408D558|nr:TetR/AcrR family transcriptional regulator [Thermocrispum municipale]
MASLREQWRREAMRRIQQCALDLFDERGFDAVTIEEIAKAAGVSASSVYRYFGTKENLVAADEFTTLTADELANIVDPADPIASLLQAVRRFESGQRDDGPWRRVRYFFAEPSVRLATLAELDRAAQRIAPLLAETHGATQARVMANALVFGYFGALERWYDDGGQRSIADYVEEGMAPLRRLWAGDQAS